MFSRKKLVIGVSTICLVTVTLFLQIGVFANQTLTTGDFTVEAEAYDVFYDCNRDGKVDMVDIFGCILRYGTEGDAVRTSYLSVPHTAFNPNTETLSYYKSSSYLQGVGHFFAEVYLPHGANVTWMAVYLQDDNPAGYVFVRFYRVDIATTSYTMAEVNSGEISTPGNTIISDVTINYPTINNNGYAYHLYLYLSADVSTLALYGVVIQYEYTP